MIFWLPEPKFVVNCSVAGWPLVKEPAVTEPGSLDEVVIDPIVPSGTLFPLRAPNFTSADPASVEPVVESGTAT